MADYGHDLSFGIFVTPAADAGARVLELARRADAAGLDWVSVQDHPYQPAFLDAWTLLAAIAATTTRIGVFPDAAAMERFAGEVAPAVRDLIASERAPGGRSGGVADDPAEASADAAPERAAVVSRTAGVEAAQAGEAARRQLRDRLGAEPTPDPGVRLSPEMIWDEATRPVGPAPGPAGEYSAAGRSFARDLVAVHDHLRAELAQLRDMIAQVADGSLDVATARTEINKLTMRQNQWTVGAYCESYCRLVGLHHTLESTALFPGLARLDSRLAPVTARLHAEHELIADVLGRVDSALVSLVTGPVRGMPSVRAAVDLLTDALLSHLSYEEYQLLEPLARFGPALYA